MSVKMRQEVERKIAEALINDAIKAGYKLSINNGDDDEIPPTDDAKTVLDAMFKTDEEHLVVYKNGSRFGWVFFVYGNDGWDVISDYTTNLEHIMENADKLSKYYE